MTRVAHRPLLTAAVASLLAPTGCPGDDTSTGGDASTTSATTTMPRTTTGEDGSSTAVVTTTMMSADSTAGSTLGSTTSTTEASTSESSSGGVVVNCPGACTPGEELCDPDTGQCLGLYACEAEGSDLDRLELVDYTEISSVAMTAGGAPVGGCTGLARGPVSGQLYMVVTEGFGANGDDVGVRRLGIVDPVTGIVTVVGPLNPPMASIAFDDGGTLYGITGQALLPTQTLFTIDTATAATTMVMTAADEPDVADGEALGFSPTTGLLYRWSGNFPPMWFSSIDAATMIETSIPPSFVVRNEISAAVFMPSGALANRFLIATQANDAISVQTDGTYVVEGSFTSAAILYKGMALAPS